MAGMGLGLLAGMRGWIRGVACGVALAMAVPPVGGGAAARTPWAAPGVIFQQALAAPLGGFFRGNRVATVIVCGLLVGSMLSEAARVGRSFLPVAPQLQSAPIPNSVHSVRQSIADLEDPQKRDAALNDLVAFARRDPHVAGQLLTLTARELTRHRESTAQAQARRKPFEGLADRLLGGPQTPPIAVQLPPAVANESSLRNLAIRQYRLFRGDAWPTPELIESLFEALSDEVAGEEAARALQSIGDDLRTKPLDKEASKDARLKARNAYASQQERLMFRWSVHSMLAYPRALSGLETFLQYATPEYVAERFSRGSRTPVNGRRRLLELWAARDDLSKLSEEHFSLIGGQLSQELQQTPENLHAVINFLQKHGFLKTIEASYFVQSYLLGQLLLDWDSAKAFGASQTELAEIEAMVREILGDSDALLWWMMGTREFKTSLLVLKLLDETGLPPTADRFMASEEITLNILVNLFWAESAEQKPYAERILKRIFKAFSSVPEVQQLYQGMTKSQAERAEADEQLRKILLDPSTRTTRLKGVSKDEIYRVWQSDTNPAHRKIFLQKLGTLAMASEILDGHLDLLNAAVDGLVDPQTREAAAALLSTNDLPIVPRGTKLLARKLISELGTPLIYPNWDEVRRGVDEELADFRKRIPKATYWHLLKYGGLNRRGVLIATRHLDEVPDESYQEIADATFAYGTEQEIKDVLLKIPEGHHQHTIDHLASRRASSIIPDRPRGDMLAEVFNRVLTSWHLFEFLAEGVPDPRTRREIYRLMANFERVDDGFHLNLGAIKTMVWDLPDPNVVKILERVKDPDLRFATDEQLLLRYPERFKSADKAGTVLAILKAARSDALAAKVIEVLASGDRVEKRPALNDGALRGLELALRTPLGRAALKAHAVDLRWESIAQPRQLIEMALDARHRAQLAADIETANDLRDLLQTLAKDPLFSEILRSIAAETIDIHLKDQTEAALDSAAFLIKPTPRLLAAA